MVKGLVYPVPDARFPFLGVHFTRMANGQVWLGPNAVPAFAREGYSFSQLNLADLLQMLTSSGSRNLALRHWRFGLKELYHSIAIERQVASLRRYMPALSLEHIQRNVKCAGVRAQAVSPDGTTPPPPP